MRFGFQKYRLMNEAVEGGDAGGSAGESVSEASNYANEYSSQNIMGESDENIFKHFGLDSSKYKFDAESGEESSEESQGSDEAEGAAHANEESAYLKWVNSLGAVHNDQPVKVESIDEVKNALQMHKDYTVKTQALSQERKEWETERTNAEKELTAAIEEFNNQRGALEKELHEMQQFRFALDHLNKVAPDVFAEIQSAYEEVGNRFKNPIVEQQMNAMNKRFSELESQLKERENKLVIDEFEREMSGLSATEQSLKELGISIDKEAVKKEWAKTGLPVKQVIGSLYFEQVAKAQASKAKVEATRAKTSAKPTGGAGGPRTGTKVKAIDPKLTGLSYAKALWDRHSTT